MVTVRVVQDFEFEGRSVRSGEAVTVQPVQAAVLRYRGVVSLLDPVRDGAVEPEEVPVPAAEPVKRRRRASSSRGTYQRRDMRATA